MINQLLTNCFSDHGARQTVNPLEKQRRILFGDDEREQKSGQWILNLKMQLTL